MSEAESQHLSIRCTECQKKLKVPIKFAGRRVSCPACKAPLNIPAIEVDPNGDDWVEVPGDSESDMAMAPAPAVPISPPSPNVSSKLLDQDLDDDFFKFADEPPEKSKTDPLLPLGIQLSSEDLAELSSPNAKAITPATGKPGPSTTSKQSNSVRSSAQTPNQRNQSSDLFGTDSTDGIDPFKGLETSDEPTEFRFPCKVCGTFQYASVDEVGSLTRCPDCYSEFSIPSPPPGWNKKRNQLAINMHEDPGVRLAEAQPTAQRTREPYARSADELLARAEAEVSKEKKESAEEVYDFDGMNWFSKTFCTWPIQLSRSLPCRLVFS